MLRIFSAALIVVMSTLSAHAGSFPSSMTAQQSPILINDNTGVLIEEKARRSEKPKVRPQRYMCVVDRSGSIGRGGRVTCPANPGRVGSRCRCNNVTGSGTLHTY